MADVFDNKQVSSLLKNKHLILIGDSNLRAQYKDLVWLLNSNTIIRTDILKRRLEKSFLGDKLLKRSELHRGRDFEEVRSYEDVKQGFKIDYMFITKCYNQHIINLFTDFKNKKKTAPSIVLMNSCLWDLTRWGPDGATLYKQNMKKLMTLFQECLPVTTLVIWSTALPVASQFRGGLLIKQPAEERKMFSFFMLYKIEFLKHTLRFDVMEANHYVRNIVCTHGYDLLDLHYYMRYQVHSDPFRTLKCNLYLQLMFRRCFDGVHYLPVAVRYMTNLLLTHIARSWGHPLPGRVSNVILERSNNSDCVKTCTDVRLPLLENIAQNKNSELKKEVTSIKQIKSLVHKAADKVSSRVGPDKPNKLYRLSRNNPY